MSRVVTAFARVAMVRARQPLFGRHGRKVVASLCAWELAALVPGSPVPTISSTVEAHPWFGVALLGMLGHHWYVELHEVIEWVEAVEASALTMSDEATL